MHSSAPLSVVKTTIVLSGHAEIVDLLQQITDVAVEFDHPVRVQAVPGLAHRRRLQMREHVHARGVEVAEPRHVLFRLALHEVEGGGQELLVHRLHPLSGQWAGVLDGLLSNLPEHRIDGRIVLVRRLALEDAAGSESGLELGVLGVVDILGLFLGVEVIEVPEELIEAMHRRQVLVAIAEMVLAELAGRVT